MGLDVNANHSDYPTASSAMYEGIDYSVYSCPKQLLKD